MATISAFVPCLEGTSTPAPLRRYRTLPSATYFMNDGHIKSTESKASERTRGGRSVNTNKGIVRSFRRVFSDDSYPTTPIPASAADVSDQRRPCLRLWVTPRQNHQSSTTVKRSPAPDTLPCSREPTPGPSTTPPRRSSLMRAKAVIGLAPTPSRIAARHRAPYPLIGVGHPSAGVVTQPNSPSIPEPLPSLAGSPPPRASSRIATPSPLSTAKSEEMDLDSPTILAHPCVAEARAAGVKVRDFAFELHSVTPAPIVVEPIVERPGIPARWSKVNSLLDAKWDLPVMTQSQPCPFSDSLVDDWPETSASQPVEGQLSREDSEQFSQARAMSLDSQLPIPEVVSFDQPSLPTGPRRSNRLRNLDTFSAGEPSPTEPSAKRRRTSSRAKSAPLESRVASKRPHRADGRKRRRAGLA